MSGDLRGDLDEFRDALLRLAFAVFEAVGLVALAERLGLQLKPWAREQQIRSRWRS